MSTTQYLRYMDPEDEGRLVSLPHPPGVPYPAIGDVFTDHQKHPVMRLFIVRQRWFDFRWDGSVDVTLIVEPYRTDPTGGRTGRQ